MATDDTVVKFPPPHSLALPFRTFCRDTDAFKALPACTKSMPKKIVWRMRDFIVLYGLMHCLVTDDDGAVLGGWQYIKKANAQHRPCVMSFIVENLSTAEKYAFAVAYDELNKAKGGML